VRKKEPPGRELKKTYEGDLLERAFAWARPFVGGFIKILTLRPKSKGFLKDLCKKKFTKGDWPEEQTDVNARRPLV
jgi:hypothetical protein